MREFMDYVHSAFYEATGWRCDNSYAALNSTSHALLNFDTPLGLRLALSSLASSNFATSYQLGSVGVVDGSISYLFSSVPLRGLTPSSESVSLPTLLRSYRPLAPLAGRDAGGASHGDKTRETLLYGRLYLPQSQLEALLVRRVSPALQVQLSAVSGQHLRNGGTALGVAQYDVGRWAAEALTSSDGGLLGLRGVYNSGGDADGGGLEQDRERIYGRFSTGGEIYYGTLNKSGGVSIGTRFATLPQHRGTPLTATLTLNPLMGNVAASYAVRAGRDCSLATRMEFNVFSYESQWAMGMELWRRRLPRDDEEEEELLRLKTVGMRSVPSVTGAGGRSFQAKMEWRLDDAQHREGMPRVPEDQEDKEEYAGVLKARIDQNLRIGVLWEGRVKSLLFSLGSGIDLRRMDKPFRTLGLEMQFSS